MPRCAGASLVVVYEIVSPLLIGNSGGDGYCSANAQSLHGADFFAAIPVCHTAWAGTSRLLAGLAPLRRRPGVLAGLDLPARRMQVYGCCERSPSSPRGRKEVMG